MIQCDSGPEYFSTAFQNWGIKRGNRIEYSQPGNPQQNAYVERFNRTLRYEWLARYLFDRVGDMQDFTTQWIWNCNHELPEHGSGWIHPEAGAGRGCMVSIFADP